MTFAYVIVSIVGIALLLTGIYYQVNKNKLDSDPILIATCYVWGGFNIATCML